MPDEAPPRAEWLTLRRRLGAGAFGVVYEAYDARRNAVVALKTLREFDAESLYTLKREFRTMADMVHPNLATLYDLVAEGASWFITMEFVDGIDLLSFLQGQSEQLLRTVFGQLAQGVEALHGAGILHRDLKPSNVLVTANARVVVLDFGLALSPIRGGVFQTDALVGSLAYMSPEQAEGSRTTDASDWYSFGMVLYEALGGRDLLAGGPLEIFNRKLHFDPVPGVPLVPGAPADLDALCVALLRRDPKARPSASEILARLRGTPQASHSARSPLARAVAAPVGRASELAALWEAFEAAQRGRLVTCHLRGRSGVGKSRLAHHFLGEVSRDAPGTIPLAGRCYEQESVPYKALDSLIDELAVYLRDLPADEAAAVMPPEAFVLPRLFPILAGAVPAAPAGAVDSVDTQELRHRAAVALRELFARMAARRPVVLFVDDVQWGDLDSGVLLRELMRPPDPPALMLLLAYRAEDADRSALLGRLRTWRESGAVGGDERDVELNELSLEQARALAQSLLDPQMPDASERAEAIARASAGNPLFVGELVQFAATAAAEGPQPEASLDGVIRARVATLPEAARRAIEVVAVAGQPLRLDVARHAAGLASERDPLLGLLRGLHLVRSKVGEGSGEVEIFHDRIRETISRGLTPALRRLRHRDLAAAWETVGGADDETLAIHLEGAGENARAVTYVVRAAEGAFDALAFDRAARLYQRALDLRAIDASSVPHLRVRLARSLANAGRGAASARAYLVASAEAPRATALDLRRCAAEQFLISGHITEGMDAMRAVMSTVGFRLARSPQTALVSLFLHQLLLRVRGLHFRQRDADQLPAETLARIDACWSASIGLSLVDAIRASDVVIRHLLLAVRAGEPYRVVRALALQLGASVLRGRRSVKRTRRLQWLTWSIARRAAQPHALGLVAANTTAMLSFEGRYGASLRMGERAEAILRERCQGVRWELDTVLIFRLHSLGWMGRWKQLAEAIPAVLREADERDDLYLATFVRGRVGHMVHLAADRPDLARKAQGEAISAWSQIGFQVQHYWDWLACTEIDLYEARPEDAWKRIEARWRDLSRSALGLHQAIFIESRWLRMRAALTLGTGKASKPALLRRAARDAARIAKQGRSWGDALATLGRAGLAASCGDRAVATHLAGEAEERFAAIDMAHYAAASRRRRGELIGGKEGQALIDDADTIFTREGVANPSRLVCMLAPGGWS
jgi:hypothetical protein